MEQKFDFGGYATKNDLKCSDGRIIRKDAFKDDNGKTVPLVWMHCHDDPENVLGHALLENKEDGVYAHCVFNNTSRAQHAKALVEHKDITALSIFANGLKQQGADVLHGSIKEVSLVMAGANPGAYIVQASLEHSDGTYTDIEDEATIYTGEEGIDISHSDEGSLDDEQTVEDVLDTLTDEQKMAVGSVIKDLLEHGDNDDSDEQIAHADEESEGKTIEDVLDTLTDEQKIAVGYVIKQLLEKEKGNAAEHSDFEGENEIMKKNVFDSETGSKNTLSHADFKGFIEDAKKNGGSFKAAVEASIENGTLAHDDLPGDVVLSDGDQKYFVNQPDFLFPEARALNNPPAWIKRDMVWVASVLNGAHHSPFARIKSVFANLTEDEARAKGYIKAHTKKEQVFSLLKRATTPQTIYKKQKMDRDDVIDITDFDAVAWIKSEMRVMLDEEIARAALIGDGRLVSDDDHISEDHIRPIYNDADLFTIKVGLNLTGTPTEDDVAKAFIRKAIRARKNYRGSGNPILFTTEDMLTTMLLLEDQIGHPLYDDEAVLARKLRVSKIVTVPVMEGFTKDNAHLLGIIVNMADYAFGADKGGAVAMFDDFDIDVNQMKYLIETRCSGALTVPYSAIAIWDVYSAGPDGTDVFFRVAADDGDGDDSGDDSNP